MSEFQFFFQHDRINRLMSPIDYKGGKIKRENEGENLIKRAKYSGGISFIGNDFKLLNQFRQSLARCNEMKLVIKRLCGKEYVPFWRGVFNLIEVEWDLDECIAKINNIQPDDEFKTLIDNYGKEFNIISVARFTSNVISKISFVNNFQFKRIEMGKIGEEEDSNWTSFLETSYWINGGVGGGTRSKTQVIFRLIRSAPTVNNEVVELEGWDVIESESSAAMTKYSKRPDLFRFKPFEYRQQRHFNRYANLIQVGLNSALPPDYVDVTGAGQASNSECGSRGLNLRQRVNDNRCVALFWNYGSFVFNRNRKLIDVIHYLVMETAPEAAQNLATDISLFFTEDINYVTGEDNKLQDILIASVSDIVGYSSDEAASKAMLSLKKLLDNLRLMFDVHFFFDENNKFRLEHRSFFSNSETVNLLDEPYKQWAENRNKFTYETSKMPQYEKLKYGSFYSPDFEEGTIEYLGNCVNRIEGQNTSENTITDFTNDLQSLLIEGGETDKAGFVLLVHKNGKVLDEIGDKSGSRIPNGHLSAANLLKYYHRENRVLLSGLLNGKPAVFNSTSKTLIQDTIKMPLNCSNSLNPFATFVTGISENGEFKSQEFAFSDLMTDLVVAHNAEPTELLAIPTRQFTDQFTQQMS